MCAFDDYGADMHLIIHHQRLQALKEDSRLPSFSDKRHTRDVRGVRKGSSGSMPAKACQASKDLNFSYVYSRDIYGHFLFSDEVAKRVSGTPLQRAAPCVTQVVAVRLPLWSGLSYEAREEIHDLLRMIVPKRLESSL